MKTVVLGRNGQVATHLRELLPEVPCLGRAELDMTDTAALRAKLLELRPQCIINAAAYTAVDKAESEPGAAWALNVNAVETIAELGQELDARVVHISTDYVFGGAKSGAFEVDDPMRPLNAYGRTKLAGELALQTLCANHLLLRTSWVFSEHGANFVKTMLRVGAERGALSVVDDQIGVPTYAGDIARVIVAATQEERSLDAGVYHVVGGPAVSWYEFAVRIFELATEFGIIDKPVAVKAIPTSEYPLPAHRPANSVLAESAAISQNLGVSFDWQTSLASVVEKISRT